MPVLEATLVNPLKFDEGGTIEVGDSRVSLDSVVYHFQQGASADEIVWNFPSLKLADVHAALAYYLNHKEEIHTYLIAQEERAEQIRSEIQQDPFQKAKQAQLDQMLEERMKQKRPA